MFIELEPKVVGLLHVSDIPDYIDLNTNKEGDAYRALIAAIPRSIYYPTKLPGGYPTKVFFAFTIPRRGRTAIPRSLFTIPRSY